MSSAGRGLSGVMLVRHLVIRFTGSLSRREPAAADVARAQEVLTGEEMRLWSAMRVEDRRHALEVLRRFDELAPDAGRAGRAAALLHDVGKLDSGLGVLGRVLATVTGPRGGRFRSYHDHVEIGAGMLEAAGSSPVTVATVRGVGPWSAALRDADDGRVVRSAGRRRTAPADGGMQG